MRSGQDGPAPMAVDVDSQRRKTIVAGGSHESEMACSALFLVTLESGQSSGTTSLRVEACRLSCHHLFRVRATREGKGRRDPRADADDRDVAVFDGPRTVTQLAGPASPA